MSVTLSGDARLAGVMGWPVAHSLSPRLHGYWLKTYAIDGAYLPLPVSPDHLEHALQALPKLGFQGVNITVPHKEAALAIVEDVDDVARRIGAINTVFVRDNGTLFGTNTDGIGFLENVGTNTDGWAPENGPAVVLGAGGSARAVVASLIDAGCPSVIVTNRTEAKAGTLVSHLGGPVRVEPWQNRADALADAALLVNTTILGLNGQPPLDISLDALPPTAVVTDLIYVPLETPLLKSAKRRGNPVVDGLGMLLHQAVPGFEGWFGTRPEVTDDLRAYVLSEPPAS